MESALTNRTTVRQDQVPFLDYPSRNRDDIKRRQCLIYLIPGNPGLIAYYEPFMKMLRQLLDETEEKHGCCHAFHIYGRNLLGFDDGDHKPAFGTTTSSSIKTEPFTLEDQIRSCYDQVQQISTSTLSHGRSFSSVILIGHSVGAYITLELFHRAATALFNTANPTPRKNPLHSAILLFPTISHIARSRSGQKLDLIRRTRFLDQSAHHLAKFFVDLLPQWLLSAIVRRLLGFPPHAAAATVRFLASGDGIWQALHMGKDEMATIGDSEGRWGQGMWEEGRRKGESNAEEEVEGDGNLNWDKAKRRARFFIYFAEKDHWVADECRDEFIERRRREGRGGTRVVVDETGIPHAFCIHHSESVAEKVKVWIEDIAGLE
ncbi:hypothetical protein N657DRAFT_666784 [Parathielavia appendiculata]|uniref:Lipid droplet-associated hydrolase n=1 Tax=Parathielavia appendiculata TaxID=2587402 RepID=A0AAN6TR61_9PEZI|nr:hypothetical protein N657DRAFT_666784 [Parathielavia appendiculata]